MTFGKAIKEQRIKRGLTQAQKRLPLLELCQDLSEEELLEVINYIKFVQSKRQAGEGE